jgi:hypothetical protein
MFHCLTFSCHCFTLHVSAYMAIVKCVGYFHFHIPKEIVFTSSYSMHDVFWFRLNFIVNAEYLIYKSRCFVHYGLAYFFTLKMEVKYSSEKSPSSGLRSFIPQSIELFTQFTRLCLDECRFNPIGPGLC